MDHEINRFEFACEYHKISIQYSDTKVNKDGPTGNKSYQTSSMII